MLEKIKEGYKKFEEVAGAVLVVVSFVVGMYVVTYKILEFLFNIVDWVFNKFTSKKKSNSEDEFDFEEDEE